MAKITPQKTSIVTQIKDLFANSKSVAIVDYKGLKVSQASDLRRNIKKAGGQYLVAKNTLFKVATGKKDFQLSNTSAFVFSQTDEIQALRAVADFAKKNLLPTFKSGFLGDRVLTAEEVTNLASLPDKTTLIAKTVGTLNAPIFRLVYHLNWNISKLVRTLEAISKNKG